MNEIARIDPKKNGARGLTAVMAERFQMEPARFVEAIKETVIKGNVSDGQLAAFLMVAHEYGLNPLTKEVYAFPSNGGIQPIVSIDGWMKLINSHPQFDGMEFQDHVGDDGKLDAVTCRIFRKDRSHSTEATEYMVECQRGTDPWKKWPRRMLRHKAAIQCARYAFSFAGIMDDDDFDRMKDVTPADRPPMHQRLEQAREATQDSQDEREGFSMENVTRETETLSSEALSEDEQHSEAAPSMVSDMSEEAAAIPAEPDNEDGGETPPAPSPSSPDLIECAHKLLGISIDEKCTPLERRNVLTKAKDMWKKNLPADDHGKLRAIFQSADAIIKEEADYDGAVSYFAETLGCDEDDIRKGPK